MDEEDWKSIGYVLASIYRRKIILALKDSPLTPKQLSQICGIGIGHVSNVLKGLRDQDLVECLNPKARKGRLYDLTETGREISTAVLGIQGE
ncbi:MAG: winged helix-turn-helix transcriptional regulator [Theionarchaea archaeon]|nr:winged helix-turn-helix transcriptional regulator [Theionarchaea archaeon]MBU7036785.1 winged helix-turn-helix transcriptional regulator [Theionarchaea archaeon]